MELIGTEASCPPEAYFAAAHTLWKGPTRCSPAYDLKFSSTISLITSREPSAEGTTAISSSTGMAAACRPSWCSVY